MAPIVSRHEELEVRIYENEKLIALDASQMVREYLSDVISRKGEAFVILATGNSQIQFLNLLIDNGGVDWSKVTLFHMDEYLGVSDDHSASFRRYMRERVAARLNPRAFHYLNGDALEP